MHFRRNEQASVPPIGLRRLPSLDRRVGDRSRAGDQTQAFRAVLRGFSPDEALKAASRETAPLPSERLASRATASSARKQRWMSGRRIAALVTAMVVLLGIGVPLVGAHFGVLTFSLGAGQNTATPAAPHLSALRSDMMEISMPDNAATTGSVQILPTATSTPVPPTATLRPKPTAVPAQPTKPPAPSGPYSSWMPPPGYTSFAVTDFAGDPWAGSFGQCTWWVAHKRPDENFLGMGNALDWANSARARGFTVTATPAPNATVVFAPGVQGASNLGHVSHVEKVLTGGWVLVSEMNFFWNGGGFARVDYRYIYAGAGVWFIH